MLIPVSPTCARPLRDKGFPRSRSRCPIWSRGDHVTCTKNKCTLNRVTSRQESPCKTSRSPFIVDTSFLSTSFSSTATYHFHSFNHKSFLDTMAARPGYAQPDPRNPFANPPMPQQFPQQYQQRRRDYDAESDFSDPFGSRNTSTTHLPANSPYYNHAGQHDHSEHHSPFILTPLCPSAFPGFYPL